MDERQTITKERIFSRNEAKVTGNQLAKETKLIISELREILSIKHQENSHSHHNPPKIFHLQE